MSLLGVLRSGVPMLCAASAGACAAAEAPASPPAPVSQSVAVTATAAAARAVPAAAAAAGRPMSAALDPWALWLATAVAGLYLLHRRDPPG